MNIGMAFFGMPPVYNRKFDKAAPSRILEAELEGRGFTISRADIASSGDLEKALSRFRADRIGCVVVFLRHWTRISLVAGLVRSAGVPAALYAQTSGGFNGTTALTAASAALRETASGYFADSHKRFREGMEEDLCGWAAAADAYSGLKASRLMCWGGFYGADMPYTRSDPDALEGMLVREVMTEQEEVLTGRADQILSAGDKRIGAFLSWLESSGMKITEDGAMVTGAVLKKQASLYIAARDRLAELSDENIRGVSLKCHFELSTTLWKCTGCFLPAFLPFFEGPEGPEKPIPVACEGDLNGLAGLVMLHALNRSVPPLFGDFAEYRDDYVLMRNCGASSVYWAGCSDSG
ncbi:MAG: hypothetical protein E4H36_15245, partial [Spirochaetales bacterium]